MKTEVSLTVPPTIPKTMSQSPRKSPTKRELVIGALTILGLLFGCITLMWIITQYLFR